MEAPKPKDQEKDGRTKKKGRSGIPISLSKLILVILVLLFGTLLYSIASQSIQLSFLPPGEGGQSPTLALGWLLGSFFVLGFIAAKIPIRWRF
ncbi:hypothetical protein H8D30_02395 [bacterium]|nr:hypothetical protein [bacterium]